MSVPRSALPRKGRLYDEQPRTLGQKRRLFTRLVGRLILKAERMGYEPQGDEWKRTAAQAALYAKQGKGIRNSLHRDSLALDIDLVRSGRLLTSSTQYEPLGEWWERQHPLCRWGGRFQKPDGRHFSLSHNGRA